MSTPKLVKTNIRAEDLLMDIRGGSNSRYYCMPPYHGEPQDSRKAPPATTGGYPFHLVAQGHVVGIFDSWPAAKASLTGYPDRQQQRRLGVHPHPVDPNAQRAGTAPDISPHKIKREGTPARNVGIDLERFRNNASPSPARSPSASPQKPRGGAPRDINFAIRGASIVSSSAVRSEERYLELQRRGEEPDLLVTRNFERASRFALEDDKE
ncbi:hypothetical protein C8F04DRAFT_1251548 [Mycena alexandri]|uniref:Ribonuclease H1 N-terminal domain-containing protein n=1 Tax=Mycena alexandri TaxID=1745969 RepID=A0AAD6TAX2_9AGAR|nr:hypothetical protein C8F04DRAFT_1251548 [Mycena alexandri]